MGLAHLRRSVVTEVEGEETSVCKGELHGHAGGAPGRRVAGLRGRRTSGDEVRGIAGCGVRDKASCRMWGTRSIEVRDAGCKVRGCGVRASAGAGFGVRGPGYGV